jgi:3'-phosphoadenosine 5'-phosphosulfate sulfotransferase (PAPS reductase)/FAD synthetase
VAGVEEWQLAQRQALSLEAKIIRSQQRIREWYEHWDGQVYVSFSGGKDSTVLLHLVREIYPDVPAVFIDTGLEYPEIKEFVRTVDGVEIVRPKMSFRQVLEYYGYPVVSKEQSKRLKEYRTTKSDKLRDVLLNGNKWGRGKISNKWRFLIDAPFKVSDMCCEVMKKRPAKAYEKKSGRKAILGTMAVESVMRATDYMKYGCNAFDMKRPISRPLGFWTEQDVLQYLTDQNLPYASVYGDIVKTKDGFVTTGCDRTGCVFCMFGCHLEKEPNRFQRLAKTHPKLYEYCMKPTSEGGLGLAEVLEYIKVDYKPLPEQLSVFEMLAAAREGGRLNC